MPEIPTGLVGSRSDYSRYLVHLTRDDRADDDNGETAFNNFRAILDQQQILALRPHCLHVRRLKQLDKKQQAYFRVACFTETPLDQIRHLTERVEGRRYQFEPFGFVFRKGLLLARGAQKAIYINGYGAQNDLYDSYESDFEIGIKRGFKGRAWRKLPFVNAMRGGCDFAWEREWRLNAHFDFELADLVCVILPPERYGPLRYKLNKLGIAMISPEWGYEEVVEELARQKRSTRTITRTAMTKKRAAR